MQAAAQGAGVQPERVARLNARPLRRGKYALLWVQQDVRAECNHALEYAATMANKLRLPLVAVYGLYEGFPEANERCFSFLIDGLVDLRDGLMARGVPLALLRCPPPEAALRLGKEAALIVCDCGYARICREWRERVAQEAACAVLQVETSVVVPVQVASTQLEPAAATLRPKLHRQLPRFLVPLRPVPLTVRCDSNVGDAGKTALLAEDVLAEAVSLDAPAALLAALEVDRAVPAVTGMRGGARRAREALGNFIAERLRGYCNGKANDPANPCHSFLSPYLHFGHISALEVALAVIEASPGRATPHRPGGALRTSTAAGAPPGDVFLEELIVRRELARNAAFYARDTYDRWEHLPGWARETLLAHDCDPRPVLYSLVQLEAGATEDPHWNAAQWQMLATGHMHNYMRMYWCKRLLEWTPDSRTAMRWAIHLNNKFQLDGRDENGWMGIAWCFGQHDRPFPERPVFGAVRSMSPAGLASKFDMAKYERMVRQLCQEEPSPAIKALLPKAAQAGNRSILAFLKAPAAAPASSQPAESHGRTIRRREGEGGHGGDNTRDGQLRNDERRSPAADTVKKQRC